MFAIEIFLLCFIAYGLTYGSLFKSYKDRERHEEVIAGLQNVKTHTDSATTALQDSDFQRTERIKKAIESDKKPIGKYSEPLLEIPRPDNVINPRLLSTNNTDSIKFEAVFRNDGNDGAKNIHLRCVSALLLRSGVFAFQKAFGKYDVYDDLVLESKSLFTYSTRFNLLPGDNDGSRFYICVFYCYKDRYDRMYGPFHNLYIWDVSNHSTYSSAPTNEQFEMFKKELSKTNDWREKFF
jgi:hypothetical protein